MAATLHTKGVEIMSSILNALKKLEKEKTLRREGEIDLSREILHDAIRRRERFPWQWAAAICVIVLLSVMVIALMTRGTSPIQQATSQPAPQQIPQQPEAALPPSSGQTVPQIVKSVPALTMPRFAPAPAAGSATGQPAAVIPVPLPTVQPPSVQPESRPSLPATAVPPAELPPPARKQAAAAPAASAEPAFSVSGIAWNKDSADRLAIINGQPLTTGSAIAGAVVEEILPDRVRFSKNGRTFEVHLGKAEKNN